MRSRQLSLAKKYASAFLNVWGEKILPEDFKKIVTIKDFFAQHKKDLFFLRLPHIGPSKKLQIIGDFIPECTVKPFLLRLLELLLDHKRAFLFYDVLDQLCEQYRQKNKIMIFSVISSHSLDSEQKQEIKQFLANKTGYEIEYDTIIKKQLIAGIRLQSDTLLWEYSIRKNLSSVDLLIIR